MQRSLSVAPMLDWTDRHCRYFLRLISRHALLYTEMVTTGAVLYGDRERLLGFHPREHPVACQLGGSDPADLAESARIAEAFGYDEINLNVGCPSDRVQRGRFGACLMAEPALVADCVAAMRRAVQVPVTVKSRIGVDERDSYEDLVQFVATVAAAGCGTFIIHARKAWLKGLSPKENREVPPLRYDVAARLKLDFPGLAIVLNGGIGSLDEVERHLERFDGAMVGRSAYHNPYALLAEADRRIFGDDHPVPSREDVLREFLPYVEAELARGTRLNAITRHVLGLYHGQPGGRAWRRRLGEQAGTPGRGADLLAPAFVPGQAWGPP
jgi:tRNA-dihydrouridine synthase A